MVAKSLSKILAELLQLLGAYLNAAAFLWNDLDPLLVTMLHSADVLVVSSEVLLARSEVRKLENG